MEAQLSTPVIVDPPAGAFRRTLTAYLELAKARLAMLVLFTTVVGYIVAAGGQIRWWQLLWTVVGTALSAFGANILNQLIERDRDRLMERTRNRPLPAGKVAPARAARWGVVSAAAGVAVLAAGTNWLTAGLSLFVIAVYVFVYTPLKVRTPFNTVVGAVCGAVPPMMGWAAAAGRLDIGAWILGGILFVWQVPHFLSLAWLYRDDYDRGGFRMLPVVDRQGSLTAMLAILYAGALLPVSAALSLTGVSGGLFLAASQLLGIAFVAAGLRFALRRSEGAARALFLASIIYLPVLLGILISDREPSGSQVPSIVVLKSTVMTDGDANVRAVH